MSVSRTETEKRTDLIIYCQLMAFYNSCLNKQNLKFIVCARKNIKKCDLAKQTRLIVMDFSSRLSLPSFSVSLISRHASVQHFFFFLIPQLSHGRGKSSATQTYVSRRCYSRSLPTPTAPRRCMRRF